jgi:hypothetical protein
MAQMGNEVYPRWWIDKIVPPRTVAGYTPPLSGGAVSQWDDSPPFRCATAFQHDIRPRCMEDKVLLWRVSQVEDAKPSGGLA